MPVTTLILRRFRAFFTVRAIDLSFFSSQERVEMTKYFVLWDEMSCLTSFLSRQEMVPRFWGSCHQNLDGLPNRFSWTALSPELQTKFNNNEANKISCIAAVACQIFNYVIGHFRYPLSTLGLSLWCRRRPKSRCLEPQLWVSVCRSERLH